MKINKQNYESDNMQESVTLKPDYSITQERMKKYGYTWNGMLALSRRAAKTLKSLDLEIFQLHPDNTESSLDYEEEFMLNHEIFGIEKDTWKKFLKTEKALEYVSARLLIVNAARKVVNEDLSCVSSSIMEWLSNLHIDEKLALETFMDQKKMPDINKLKPYISEIVKEFTNRISFVGLESYGWNEENVSTAIIKYIADEEIKNYAISLVEQGLTVDYKSIVLESVEKEFNDFRRDCWRLDSEALFNKYYEIYIKIELSQTLYGGDFLDSVEYKVLYKDKGNILDLMYSDFISNEYSSVGSMEDTIDFIKDYIENCIEEND